jgi:hypothetical protein
MSVIPETRRVHWIWYLHIFYLPYPYIFRRWCIKHGILWEQLQNLIENRRCAKLILPTHTYISAYFSGYWYRHFV